MSNTGQSQQTTRGRGRSTSSAASAASATSGGSDQSGYYQQQPSYYYTDNHPQPRQQQQFSGYPVNNMSNNPYEYTNTHPQIQSSGYYPSANTTIHTATTTATSSIVGGGGNDGRPIPGIDGNDFDPQLLDVNWDMLDFSDEQLLLGELDSPNGGNGVTGLVPGPNSLEMPPPQQEQRFAPQQGYTGAPIPPPQSGGGYYQYSPQSTSPPCVPLQQHHLQQHQQQWQQQQQRQWGNGQLPQQGYYGQAQQYNPASVPVQQQQHSLPQQQKPFSNILNDPNSHTSSRKHKRDNVGMLERWNSGNSFSTVGSVHGENHNQFDLGEDYPEDNGYNEDEDGECIKAMRYGSLGRIMASTSVATSSDTAIVKKNDASVPVTPSPPHATSNSSGTTASSLMGNMLGAVLGLGHSQTPPPTTQTDEERAEIRKGIITKMMKFLQFSDMNALAKLIREHFHEQCMFITPDLSEPLVGKGDIMTAFSLKLEAFPDGVWNVLSISFPQVDIVSCQYRFTGTRLFPFTFDVLFKQVKSHIARHCELPNAFNQVSITDSGMGDLTVTTTSAGGRLSTTTTPRTSVAGNISLTGSHTNVNSNNVNSTDANILSLSSEKLMNEVTESCLVVPIIDPPHQTSSSKGASDSRRPSLSNSQHSHSSKNVLLTTEKSGEEDSPIRLPRRVQSLREVKTLETAVLKEGPTSYKRKIEATFDDENKIIRFVSSSIVA